VGQHFVAVFEFDAEHGVRQRLGHRPLKDDRIFFWLCQGTAPARDDLCWTTAPDTRTDARLIWPKGNPSGRPLRTQNRHRWAPMMW
jgi:hypothetical protein